MAFFTKYVEIKRDIEREYTINFEQKKSIGWGISSRIEFAYINLYGDVTSFFIINISVHNIKASSFKKTLNGQFLKIIR
jgi:hypothetical protein